MLPREFTERTKVTLTGDEYAEVEHIYNSVQMNKDEFCELWLKNRDNKIIAELMNTIKKLENDCEILKKDFDDQLKENEEQKALHKQELEQTELMHRNHMEDFAKKLIKAGEYTFPDDFYQVVEEEFGIQFIIRSKWEQDIDLTADEIDYMVKHMK